jgi:methyl-accepting chemotaxis protein
LIVNTSEAVSEVTTVLEELNAASQEQNKGINQINGAVTQLNSVVQNNAASAEETAAASEELSAQAESLNGVVRDLTVIVRGANGSGSQRGESAHGSNGLSLGLPGLAANSVRKGSSLRDAIRDEQEGPAMPSSHIAKPAPPMQFREIH